MNLRGIWPICPDGFCLIDVQRIQQVVEQASRLNQAVSSVMGGASTRASISFGGYYDGF